MSPKDIAPPKIESFIKGPAEEEILYFNRLIVERSKPIAQVKNTRALSCFILGEGVLFIDHELRPKTGSNVRIV